jgi:HSP20 family molecular chaperone IbpA
MKEKVFVDLGRIMDEVLNAAQDFGNAFKEEFKKGPCGDWSHHHWDEKVDYYPSHMYPPTNVYLKDGRNLVFEFALAGFSEREMDLQFQGDYMVLNAKVPPELKVEAENVKYFKRRLKFKDIESQKYYAPADKFDQENASAVFKNGVLIVTIPGKETGGTQEGIKVNIERGVE